MYSAKSKGKISFTVVLITVVLAFCVLIGVVSAWLTKDYNPRSEDNKIGEVKVELYQDGTKVEGAIREVNGVNRWECNEPYEIGGNGEIRSLNLTMRNNGSIDALVRATIVLYYFDSNNNKVVLINTEDTPTLDNECKLDTTAWIYSMASENGVIGGYMFYNDQLSPYTYKEITTDVPGEEIQEVTVPANEKNIINSIRVSPNLISKAIYVDITLDAIAYTGNIYYKMEYDGLELDDTEYSALPFGTKDKLPGDWLAWKERYD